MALPQPSIVYILGPYSLILDPDGRYYFPGSFKPDTLIPGTVLRDMIVGEGDSSVWERSGDKNRIPEVITVKGDLIASRSIDGLRADARLLERSANAATALIRDNGDGTARKISLDGGDVVTKVITEFHYQAVITLYPTTETVASDVAPNVPTMRNRQTTTGALRETTSGRTRVAVTLDLTGTSDGTKYTVDSTALTADYTGS